MYKDNYWETYADLTQMFYLNDQDICWADWIDPLLTGMSNDNDIWTMHNCCY